MSNVSLRPGLDSDGLRIKELLELSGFPKINMKWEKIEPSWVVAEIDGEIAGAIMIGFGVPIGRIEMMCLSSSIKRKDRAKCATLLFQAAKGALSRMGSEIAMALISDCNKQFQTLCIKHGAVPVDNGQLMVYSL